MSFSPPQATADRSPTPSRPRRAPALRRDTSVEPSLEDENDLAGSLTAVERTSDELFDRRR